MCGIAGIALDPGRTLPDLHERLLAMREAMTHRGPDDAGACVSSEGRLGLANQQQYTAKIAMCSEVTACNRSRQMTTKMETKG